MKNIPLITGAYGGLGTCFATIHAERKGDLILVEIIKEIYNK